MEEIKLNPKIIHVKEPISLLVTEQGEISTYTLVVRFNPERAMEEGGRGMGMGPTRPCLDQPLLTLHSTILYTFHHAYLLLKSMKSVINAYQ